MQIINVNFRKDSGEYGFQKYSYYCDIPNVAVGDVVVAPTDRGGRPARVAEVDVPESKVDMRFLPKLKTITEREVPDENNRA